MSPCLILLVLFTSEVISQESWVVNTEYGDVRGYWSEEYQVWQFLGIPYAAPPVGNLRFKAPVPPEPWTDIFNATEIKSVCMQPYEYSEGFDDEDCLIINVYVPQSARTGNALPVLYFSHGGGWYYGSSKGYNPYHTTRHDVILVTFNYRLGVFGFMCLGTEQIPGNAGLKDHIATLRWTNNNIANFGGDPNSVTIYGESAGAANIEALILSPVTEGLFQRAILESGTALLVEAFNRNRLGYAKAIALSLGCSNVDDMDNLAECLKEAPAADLNIYGQTYRPSFCIEKELDGVERAVTSDPIEILESTNYEMVPILYAFSELEGSTFISTINELSKTFNNSYDDSFIPVNINLTVQETFVVNENFKNIYFNTTEDSMLTVFIFYTDVKFLNCIYRSLLQNVVNGNTVYLFKYAYSGGFNLNTTYAKLYNTSGHADIVANIMDLGYFDNETLVQDQIIRDRMTEIWTNFVKYGVPLLENNTLGVEWLPFTEAEQHMLVMDKEVSVSVLDNQERLSYWVELYEKYYYPLPVFNAAVSPGLSVFVLITFVILTMIKY